MNDEAASGDSGGFLTRFVWTIQSPRKLYVAIASGEVHWLHSDQ